MAREVTIEFNAETAELEAGLERAIGLAERFNEVWGDAPRPDGITVPELKPGDVVVLRYDEVLTQDAVDRIAERLREIFPDHKVMVLDRGARLEAVRPSNPEQEGRDAA